MIVVDSKRNIQRNFEFKNNFNYSVQISELEPFIDGAHIDSIDFINLDEANRLFKEFVVSKTGFSNEEFQKSFNPIQKINAFDFMMNPYLKNIYLNDIEINDIKLTKEFYRANEFTIFNEPSQDSNLIKKYTIGIFDNPAYTYLLRNNDFVWMSINPMEINTAERAIQNAHGKVLVLGGGLGYYPYMVSLKDDVTSVTIVEENKIIKDILEISIIPQFNNKKVQIIQDNAYEYIKNNVAKKYDSIFIDIWQDNVKGTEDYKYFVKYEEKYPEAVFDYWLEDSILDSIVVNIYQYFSAKLGTDDYQKYFSLIAPDLWEYFEAMPDVIARPDQMDYYLTHSFAKKYLMESR